MNFSDLKSVFSANGCREIYVKKLAANDINKSQVYVGGSFELLNIFPIAKIEAITTNKKKAQKKKKDDHFFVNLNFCWIADDLHLYSAPHAKFILYPQYPEVRFSGFLEGCQNAPSKLMTTKQSNRLLFLSVTRNKQVLGYVSSPHSNVSADCKKHLKSADDLGVFKIIKLTDEALFKRKLITQLRRIHNLGWISSKRLDKQGIIQSCNASNCGGYTLEAELEIKPNGRSEPDFVGWEVKQFGVTNFSRPGSRVITLMTPEPTGGYYKTHGLIEFLKKYGYKDKKKRAGRLNFGGVHKYGIINNTTGLILRFVGYDKKKGKIAKSGGSICLVDSDGKIAVSWSFAKLIERWSSKHNHACYVPSICKKGKRRKYKYGHLVFLNTGTDFELFLRQMVAGHIYYDPGIKYSSIGGTKARSQFRTKFIYLNDLYKKNEIVDLSLK